MTKPNSVFWIHFTGLRIETITDIQSNTTKIQVFPSCVCKLQITAELRSHCSLWMQEKRIWSQEGSFSSPKRKMHVGQFCVGGICLQFSLWGVGWCGPILHMDYPVQPLDFENFYHLGGKRTLKTTEKGGVHEKPIEKKIFSV